MKLRSGIAAGLLGLLALAPVALAQESKSASPWTQAASYQEKALHKLDFGLKNTFFGWTELFEEPWTAWRNNKEECLCKAKMRGLAHAIQDTLGGALHVASFPLTQVDLPLPENGVEY